MKADQVLLRAASRWFLAVLTLGIWLRSAFVWTYNPRPFEWGSLIHAHSHTAYFGWAGLGLMGLILHVLPPLTGQALVAPRPLRWLLTLAPWAVGGALLTFAFFGYSPPSIAFSAFNEIIWYFFAYVFWQNVKGRPVRDWPAPLWLIGAAVVLLLVSTLSTVLIIITRVILPASNPVMYNSGVYLFLQAYGDGFLEVGVMGVAAALAGGLRNRGLARWQAMLQLVLMVPAALRLLVPFGLGGSWAALGVAAGFGLGAAQVLYLVNMAPSLGRVPAAVRPWWLLAGASLGAKAILEALPVLPGWTALAQDRNLVIAFLHLKLLMLVSAGLMGALGYVRRLGRGFPLFAGGAAVMVGALAAHGFWAGGNPELGHALYTIAFVAAIAAATGAAGAVWPSAKT